MADWDALVEFLAVATDIAATWFFYKLYRDKCATADHIEKCPPLELSTLKSLADTHPEGHIPYAAVEGMVSPVGASLKSQYTDDEGPIKLLKRYVHKRERYRGYWNDHTSIISESYDQVQFSLVDKLSGSSIVLTEVKLAECLSDALHTTYDQFEPNSRSLTESVFDRVVGEITKGYRTKEQMLRNGTAMLGVGKIVVSDGGILELHEPTLPNSPYIVTSMTKAELVQYLQSKATIYKVIAGIFGLTGIALLWVTLRPRIQQWLERRRANQAIDNVRDQITTHRNTSDLPESADGEESLCVICWANPKEIANRPCGHVCTCLVCYEALPFPQHCPMCRQSIDEIIPVFIS